jgi:hypothetical protein
MSFFRPLALGLMCLSTPLAAQEDPSTNVFFGFDFVLVPIAIKWACGGDSEEDLARIDAVVEAFPEDAEKAEMDRILTDLQKARTGEVAIDQIVGGQLNDAQEERLCTAATKLDLTHLSPDSFQVGGDSTLSKEQQLAWRNFFFTIENLSS